MVKSEKQRKHLEKLNSNQDGKINRNWKGGFFISGYGYKMVKAEYHPRANKGGYVFEHILVIEKFIGRFLNKEEIVHHINEIRTDNRIENLELTNRSKHMIFHNEKSRRLKSVRI